MCFGIFTYNLILKCIIIYTVYIHISNRIGNGVGLGALEDQAAPAAGVHGEGAGRGTWEGGASRGCAQEGSRLKGS